MQYLVKLFNKSCTRIAKVLIEFYNLNQPDHHANHIRSIYLPIKHPNSLTLYQSLQVRRRIEKQRMMSFLELSN